MGRTNVDEISAGVQPIRRNHYVNGLMELVLQCGGRVGVGQISYRGWMLLLGIGFYLREAFQSQTNTQKILHNKSRWALICYRN